MRTTNRLAKAAALLLALALTTIPALAAAQVGLVAPVEVGDKVPEFGDVRSCLGVSASDKWLRQARIGGMLLNLRVHDADGETIQFQENLGRLSERTSALRLTIRARCRQDGATLQIDQTALDVLSRVEIEEIVVTNYEYVVLARYARADIQTLRDGLALREGELICLSGEDEPVTVVGEDGVRRMISL